MDDLYFEQDCFDDDFSDAEEVLDLVDDLLNIEQEEE